MSLKLKPIEILRLAGNFLLSVAAVVLTAILYNAFGFDLPLGAALILCALITSTQMLTFFRRMGTFPAWLVLAILFLLPILFCKDGGTGLLIGTIAVAIPLAVSFFWPPLRGIAPLSKWALPTAGGFLFLGTLGYSALHFDSVSFAPIQERIVVKWIAYIKGMESMLQAFYPAEYTKKIQPLLDLMMQKEQAAISAFSFLMMAVIAMFGIFFIAVFAADWRLKQEGERRWCGSWRALIPTRGISWVFMIVNILCGFAPQEIYMPLNATMTLFGFFFIFVAVYTIERGLARKKVHGALRALLVIVLFALSFFNAGAGIYTLLLFIGWWIATSPVKVHVIKK